MIMTEWVLLVYKITSSQMRRNYMIILRITVSILLNLL